MNILSSELLNFFPVSTHDMLNNCWQVFATQCEEQAELLLAEDHHLQSLLGTWVCSDYAFKVCMQESEWLIELFAKKQFTSASYIKNLNSRCENYIQQANNKAQLISLLRQFRRQEQFYIIHKRSNGLITYEDEARFLSQMADIVIIKTINKLLQWQTQYVEHPKSQTGKPLSLIVLGLGKLGGKELNLSSDIDLIFTFLEEGKNGEESYGEFFTKLARNFIDVMMSSQEPEFVFRVDMRLRPFGDSGALVLSLNAMERYYQQHGREWERYAMLKARVITGTVEERQKVRSLLRPFVYRRYIDYSVIDSLREMKSLIQQEVRQKRIENNIKLGPGGIREIEFVAQLLQLIHGGRRPECQLKNLRDTLRALYKMNFIGEDDYQTLDSSYLFLRTLEHAIQAFNDEQTHSLPKDQNQAERIAYAMNYKEWSEVEKTLKMHRHKVEKIFQAQIALPKEEVRIETVEHGVELIAIWKQELPKGEALDVLSKLGFTDSQRIWQLIDGFARYGKSNNLSANGQKRLAQLIPKLLHKVAKLDNSDETLLRVYEVVRAIARRSAYILLLLQNEKALDRLLSLCSSSPWFSEQITKYPVLLDELLDERSLYASYDSKFLSELVQSQLLSLPEDDLEGQMDVLRVAKQGQILKIAACDVSEKLPIMKVSDQLTDAAEVVLGQVVKLAVSNLSYRSTNWAYWQNNLRSLPFAILAYGKLAGFELGYDSDLDITFLYDATVVDEKEKSELMEFCLRLAQRITHLLSTQTSYGVLYQVDTRLRPSGESGLLISSFDAFADYQMNHAWTWEHQALVRSRVVFGNDSVTEKLKKIRNKALTKPRELSKLKTDILDMREKLKQNFVTKKAKFHLKHDTSGITDIEFIAQYAVLAWANENKELLVWPDNIRIFETSMALNLMSEAVANDLIEIYKKYRHTAHHLALQNLQPWVAESEYHTERQRISEIWSLFF